ncbi:MAG: hypothetical protein JRI52_07145 [Deltaproteobacteria bacterium]|jgi:hypothetical protein|nr:hypothetical protein [Deltaproteobacteria bacterium]
MIRIDREERKGIGRKAVDDVYYRDFGILTTAFCSAPGKWSQEIYQPGLRAWDWI